MREGVAAFQISAPCLGFVNKKPVFVAEGYYVTLSRPPGHGPHITLMSDGGAVIFANVLSLDDALAMHASLGDAIADYQNLKGDEPMARPDLRVVRDDD